MPRKGVECARDKQFARKRQPLRLGLRLHFQQAVKVFQRRGCAGAAAVKVGLVQKFRAATQNRLFGGGQAARQLLKQRKHKLAFRNDRVAVVAVLLVHIQRVDVRVGCGGDLNDFAAEGTGQVTELTFGIKDENIILGRQRDLHDFLFCRHGLAGTGNTQAERIAVEQKPPIRHDSVFAHSVLPVVNAARLHDLLRAERNQHGGAFGRQCAQRLDAPHTVGQHGVQPVALLPAQRRKLTQMLAPDREQRFGVAVELALAVGQMHQRDKAKHHALVAGGQIVQHFFGFLALQFHVIWDRGGKVVVGVLAALPVGGVRFHTQQRILQLTGGLVGRHGQDVDGQHQVAVKVA